MKDIIGYENYAIDEDGNVYSKNYRRTGKTKKLKLFGNGHGYLCVGLYKDRKRKTKKVHRLLAEAYLSDFCNELDVDHIDRDRQNNNLSNLRMVTEQQNKWNSGAKGYTFKKHLTKPWQAQIMKDGKKIHLGYFAIEEDARQAYLTAKDTLHAI